MAWAEPRRRLIVTADDFGRSSTINHAVIRAHREGILTCASLMASGEAFDEAVELARQNPRLGVGLHLTLCRGRAVLPPAHLPDLVDEHGHFAGNPVLAGLKYFFHPAAASQLQQEIEAQLRKFEQTGLTLDHLNGHLHFHLHPTVLGIIQQLSRRFPIRALRLTREPWERNLLEEEGRWCYRLSHAAIFECLSRWSMAQLRNTKITCTDTVFGLLQNEHVEENYLLRLMDALPIGTSELYAHPSMENGPELQALISNRVADAVQKRRVELIRYQDLWSNC